MIKMCCRQQQLSRSFQASQNMGLIQYLLNLQTKKTKILVFCTCSKKNLHILTQFLPGEWFFKFWNKRKSYGVKSVKCDGEVKCEPMCCHGEKAVLSSKIDVRSRLNSLYKFFDCRHRKRRVTIYSIRFLILQRLFHFKNKNRTTCRWCSFSIFLKFSYITFPIRGQNKTASLIRQLNFWQ